MASSTFIFFITRQWRTARTSYTIHANDFENVCFKTIQFDSHSNQPTNPILQMNDEAEKQSGISLEINFTRRIERKVCGTLSTMIPVW